MSYQAEKDIAAIDAILSKEELSCDEILDKIIDIVDRPQFKKGQEVRLKRTSARFTWRITVAGQFTCFVARVLADGGILTDRSTDTLVRYEDIVRL